MQEALSKCVNSFHLINYLTYQPANRYWTFQWYELGSYIVLSALLVGIQHLVGTASLSANGFNDECSRTYTTADRAMDDSSQRMFPH